MCKLIFAKNKYAKQLMLLVISSCFFSLSAFASDKWVVADGSQPNAVTSSSSSISSVQPVVETNNVEDGLQIYNYNSRRLVTSLLKSTPLNVVGGNDNWVYVTVTGYPVWVHVNYVKRDQGVVEVVVQEGKLNLRKEPNKYAMTLGSADNGYQSREIDYKDPWVKIIAPSDIKFAVKKADFDSLQQEGIVISNREPEIESMEKEDSPKVALPDDFEQQSSVNVREAKPAVEEQNEWKTATNIQQNESPVASDSIDDGLVNINQPKPQKANVVTASGNQIPYTDALIYRLTAGDVISVQVYGESELGVSQVRIPEGGVISFPLIGQIKVAGKTAVAVENLVTRKLADGYIRNPKVSLIIDNYRPIYIRGAVLKSGAFPFTEGLTIAKAITLGGGATKAARFDGVSLVRKNSTVNEQLSVDSQVLVQPGDIISIAEEIGGTSENAIEYIYLHGEVRSPGGYDFRKGLTVEKAVALAGGFSARASKKRINISRQVIGQQEPLQIKKVDLYFPIKPGDVISVGASWF